MIYTIQQGDSLMSVCHSNWKYIYYLPRNEQFRKDFPDPHLIQAGADIYIPQLTDNDLTTEDAMYLMRRYKYHDDNVLTAMVLFQDLFGKEYQCRVAFCGSVGLWLQGKGLPGKRFGDFDVWTDRLFEADDLHFRIDKISYFGYLCYRYSLDILHRKDDCFDALIEFDKNKLVRLENGIWVKDWRAMGMFNAIMRESYGDKEKPRFEIEPDSETRNAIAKVFSPQEKGIANTELV